MQRLIVTALACGLAGACGGDDGGGSLDETDGGIPDGPPAPTWTFPDVHGVPNLDDDDGATVDWQQATLAVGDNDLSTLTLPATTLSLVPAGGTVELALAGDVANVRLYKGGVLAALPFSFTPTGADEVLTVEFGQYLATATLTLTARDASGATTSTATAKLQAAPLIINHHLQPAEALWAVAVNSNTSFIDTYETVLGDKFTAVSGTSVQGDVWMQDEFEFATLRGDQGQRVDTVIDSIRDRGLRNYSRQWVRPDEYTQTWGTAGQQISMDSFGNLEASPPVTVNGVEYPFGRIYFGRVNNTGLNSQLATFLTSQKIQAPIQLPTNWLCVGHVDEFSSFVPDPSSPKGFKFVISDTTAAWTLLASLDRTAPLPKYAEDHGYATVGDLLDDTALRALNADVQAENLEPIITTMKTELGLTDADIIRVPSLFEEPNQCNGRVAALIPGMVNLIIANVDGATTHLFTADPFFRNGGAQDTDPVIAAFTQLMPAGMQLHFLDNWNTYHMGLGEVHCGTNVRRTPTATWWTGAGAALLGGN